MFYSDKTSFSLIEHYRSWSIRAWSIRAWSMWFFEMLSVSCACTKISQKTKNPKNFPFKMDFFFRFIFVHSSFTTSPQLHQVNVYNENGPKKTDVEEKILCAELFFPRNACVRFSIIMYRVCSTVLCAYIQIFSTHSLISLYTEPFRVARASLWIHFVLLLGPVLYTSSMYVRRERKRRRSSSSGKATTTT